MLDQLYLSPCFIKWLKINKKVLLLRQEERFDVEGLMLNKSLPISHDWVFRVRVPGEHGQRDNTSVSHITPGGWVLAITPQGLWLASWPRATVGLSDTRKARWGTEVRPSSVYIALAALTRLKTRRPLPRANCAADLPELSLRLHSSASIRDFEHFL